MQRIIIKIQLQLIFSLIFFSSVNAQSWQASKEIVDRLSKNQTEINYFEEKVPAYTLPELLITSKNEKIVTRKEWERIRRPEILELFTSQVYGRIPNTPYQTEFKIIKEDPVALNGAATLKEVDIRISANAKTLTIHLGLFIPNKEKKPVPAFLLICNRPPSVNIDFTRENKSEFWPVEEIIARGYAAAAFYNGDVDPDTYDEFKNGIHELLDTKRNNESWGTLAAWAWGASRCLDYLTSDKAIASDQVAVIGHSRGGKTALWAGAVDKRFAMVCCNEAGCGGSSLARRKYGETIDRINKVFPHWFCINYKTYSNRENEMPFDMHELMALIAPRALYVAAASEDLWADPKGQYLALYYSLPVFQLYNKKTSLPLAMPSINTPVRSKNVAYHVREGVHNLILKDWNFYMDQADIVLKKK